MPRVSAFRGTWEPNQRPHLVLAPDAYVSIQGSTSVIACGECRREVNFNHYVTQISTEASVDSPPGSATVSLSIPDADVNNFFVDGQFMIIDMMEIELFSKGYFIIGGTPQYYKIFWGIISSVSKSWSNGVTTVQLSCKDILRWWELTSCTINPAYLDPFKSSAGGYQLFQNQFAGLNPYTVIITLAKDSMGDFSQTTGSLNQTFKPELGPESKVIGSYSRDIMAYWQLKFGNMWNSLVLFGSSGKAYTLSGPGGTVNAVEISRKIFEEEARRKGAEGKSTGLGSANESFMLHPEEQAAFKIQIDKAGDVEFFQNETQSKLSIALTARDQSGFEFYCDTTGDIIFKPPFYNMNVIPNKPVSWIQDFEIIDDNITDSEQEVYTHITSSGNAFGGVTDWGLNDEITTPRTGVFDFHLLKRYGWRRLDYQCEWAGNPRKLFFHLMDHLDKVNAKRQSGSITIPLRPELRMGFPVWIPKYDSFFYVQGISHQYAPGGQATTTLTLIAKRSKFIAPGIIGKIAQTDHPKKTGGIPSPDPNDPSFKKMSKEAQQAALKKADNSQKTYRIDFPQHAGETAGLGTTDADDGNSHGKPIVIRDPKTGKMLGFPNVVMVLTKTLEDKVIGQIIKESGSKKGVQNPSPGAQNAKTSGGSSFDYASVVRDNLRRLMGIQRAETLSKLRAHRYEAGMSNVGGYDYAWDSGANFKEIGVIAAESVEYGAGLQNPQGSTTSKEEADRIQKSKESELKSQATAQEAVVNSAASEAKAASDAYDLAKQTYDKYLKQAYSERTVVDNLPFSNNSYTMADLKQKELVDSALQRKNEAVKNLDVEKLKLSGLKLGAKGVKLASSLNMIVRPVSDEFGFEVIGHYRYGRGTFIERGKIGNTAQVPNKVSIQFAATGGMLTDGPKMGNSDPMSSDFSKTFEEMRPEDWTTGNSFDHGDDNKGAPQNFTPTGQNTYSNAINDTASRAGSAVYVEADATRRSKTLAEMRPTLSTGIEEMTEKCACWLSKTAWLSVLPQESLDKILKPVSTVTASKSKEEIKDAQVFKENGLTEKIKAQKQLESASKLALDQAIVAYDYFNFKKESGTEAGKAKDAADFAAAAIRKSDAEKAYASSKNATLDLEKELSQSKTDAAVRSSLVDVVSSIEYAPSMGASQLVDSDIKKDSQVSYVNASGVPFVANKGGFFDILRDFLIEKFKKDYESNAAREQRNTGSSRAINNPNTDPIEATNLIDDPSSPLFQRAATGDKDALEALKNQANFGFGLSSDEIKNFKKSISDAEGTLKKSIADLASSYDGMVPKDFFEFTTSGTPEQQNLSGLQNQRNTLKNLIDKTEELLRKDPTNKSIKDIYDQAISDFGIIQNDIRIASNPIEAAALKKQAEISKGRQTLIDAQYQYDQAKQLLSNHPGDQVFMDLFQSAKNYLDKSQQALRYMENSPVGITSGQQRQPVTLLPTTSSTVNSKYLDVEAYGDFPIRKGPE